MPAKVRALTDNHGWILYDVATLPLVTLDQRGNSSLPKPGDLAPDFELNTVNGLSVSLLGTLSEGHTVLLVFLRHLG